jgi:SnoaL-like domain
MSDLAEAAALLDRLETFAARATITDVIYRYARNIRYGAYAELRELFTEDAFFEQRGGELGQLAQARVLARYEGRAAILDHLGKGASSGGGVCPMIHNVLIDVSGDEAASDCVMTGFIAANASRILGEYRDTFRRDGGVWRFTSRTHTMLHHSGADSA